VSVCPWVIQVLSKLNGVEYPAVIQANMLSRPINTETLPTWRTLAVPPEFAGFTQSEILAACYDGRIPWRKATSLPASTPPAALTSTSPSAAGSA
jgi:hypothetical protein